MLSPENPPNSPKPKEIAEIAELAEKISRVIPENKRMTLRLYISQHIPYHPEAESLSHSVLNMGEIIKNKKTGSFSKLLILKELLMPELKERLENVEVPFIEFALQDLLDLEPRKIFKILLIVSAWEKWTGLRVRLDGVVGKGENNSDLPIENKKDEEKKTLEEAPIENNATDENKLDQLLEKFEDYQRWLLAVGPHSKLGKFYRRETLKLTTNIIIETINYNAEAIGFTHQELVETCQETLELSKEEVLLEILETGRATEGVDAPLEDVVIAGTMSLAGQIGLGNYA